MAILLRNVFSICDTFVEFAVSKNLLLPLELQETRMLSQALNRAMPHSRNQLEGVNRKEVNILFSCSIVLHIEAVNLRPHCSLKQYSMVILLSSI